MIEQTFKTMHHQRTTLFEAFLFTILSIPVSSFLVAWLGAPHYAFLIGTLTSLAVLLITLLRTKVASEGAYLSEIPSFVVFVCAFLFFLTLCDTWPDIISMGERIRDYALLGSVMKSPFVANEPWLDGAPLNYYLYWYRLGAFFGWAGRLETHETYNVLASFTYALYFTSLFRLMFAYVRLGAIASLAVTVAIALGSNIKGLLIALANSGDWWAPSRVITGTINEFPAWSFLLGDLHPHFLNYGLIPFALCCLFALRASPIAWQRTSAPLVLLVPLGLWTYNANAWEVPTALLTIAGAFSFVLMREWLNGSAAFGGFKAFNSSTLLWLGAAVVGSLSLYLSSRNIVPADYSWRLVAEPVARSTSSEILLVWGLPLAIVYLSLATAFFSRPWILVSVFFSALLLLTGSVTLGLISLIALLIVESYSQAKSATSEPSFILRNFCALLALTLVLFCEFLFLDDPYGGENERMNTVFKFYCSAWTLFGVSAGIRVVELFQFFQRRQLTMISAVLGIALVTGTTAFFWHVIPIRKQLSQQGSTLGLGKPNEEFPGLKDVVTFLRQQPTARVLEAQGPAYSYTSVVASLSSQPSFLGWTNHVNLLNRMGEEIGRRERVTQQIYESKDCSEKLRLAKENDISWIVLGPLEYKKYPMDKQSFSCLNAAVRSGQFDLYSIQ